jgi:phosphatidylglycerophosphate synthase
MTGRDAGTLWIAWAQAGADPLTPLLGLPLLRRAVLAAERAGFSRLLVEEPEGRDLAATLAETRAEIVRSGAPSPEISPGRLVVLSSAIVAEKRWLKELWEMPVEPDRPEIDPGCAAVVETADPAKVVSLLRGRGHRDAFEALAAFFPAAGELSSDDRIPVARPEDLGRAEKWLLRRLIKDSEGFMSRHVERRISLAISRRLASTSVTPNAMTVFSVGVGLVGAAFFLGTASWAPLAGALIVLAHSILDGCDGELARLKFQESRFGGVLDFWGDNVVHSAVFASIAIAWARDSGQAWPLLAGALAVLGTLLSAGFVYRHTMAGVTEGPLFTSVSRAPDSPSARLANALGGGREFLYLLVILSALHRERWFLALAAVGSPVYFLLLLRAARSGGSRKAALSPAAASLENHR